MPELALPIWAIAALGAIPLIWWVHRFDRAFSDVSVSALFLWKSKGAASESGRQAGRPDPVWRLRAITAVCLFLGVAQPSWQESVGATIQVWFDDSASMSALENNGPRWKLAISALVDTLQSVGPERVVVTSLSLPGKSLDLDPRRTDRWSQELAEWIVLDSLERDLPIANLMMSNTNHWLVSDGADPALIAWLRTAPIDRVVWVGSATENVGITRLALRRSLRDPDTWIGLVEIRNFGDRPAQRQLTVEAGDIVERRIDLMLAPGQKALERFEIDSKGETSIRAILDPSDSLRLDDELTLAAPSAAAKVPVAVDEGCGTFIQAALAVHPALELTSRAARNPPLSISCGSERPTGEGAQIWFRRGHVAIPVTDPPLWDFAVGPLRELLLKPEWLQHYDQPLGPAAFRPILMAGKTPLILQDQANSKIIEVRFDVDFPNLVRRPEFAALVSGLVDLAVGRALLDEFAMAVHRPGVSRIAPQELPAIERGVSPGKSSISMDLSPYFIVAALIFLFVDMFGMMMRRTGRRLSSPGVR